MDTLPEDCLALLVRHLDDAQDVGNLGACCKHLARVTRNDQQWARIYRARWTAPRRLVELATSASLPSNAPGLWPGRLILVDGEALAILVTVPGRDSGGLCACVTQSGEMAPLHVADGFQRRVTATGILDFLQGPWRREYALRLLVKKALDCCVGHIAQDPRCMLALQHLAKYPRQRLPSAVWKFHVKVVLALHEMALEHLDATQHSALARLVRTQLVVSDFRRVLVAESRGAELPMSVGALLISTWLCPLSNPEMAALELKELGDELRRRCASLVPPTPGDQAAEDRWVAGVVGLARALLFTDFGLQPAPVALYYHENNSLLGLILTRQWIYVIPLTVSVIMQHVCSRAGLRLSATSMPAHFVLGVEPLEGGPCRWWVDAYLHANLLDWDGVQRVPVAHGVHWHPAYLYCSHRHVWKRMLRNVAKTKLGQRLDGAGSLRDIWALCASEPPSDMSSAPVMDGAFEYDLAQEAGVPSLIEGFLE